VTDFGESAEGQTPVDADDAQYLTEDYSWITTREELNDAETSNIADAMLWLGDQERSAFHRYASRRSYKYYSGTWVSGSSTTPTTGWRSAFAITTGSYSSTRS
jgi:hypothetical protein